MDINPHSVVVNEYPNPLENTDGNLCGDEPYQNKNNAWYATRMLIPKIIRPSRWEINLTTWEAGEVNVRVVPVLNNTIRDTAERLHWSAVSMHGVMADKGWCTGNQQSLIAPQEAHSWIAYENKIRMIRTSNDSLLTQSPGNSGKEDGLDGTFHPNAQGYAAMADAVMKVVH